MEEEEREAQSAKLQELIRRGSPEDLREANRLMKIMAGYDTRSKTDYRAKAAEDVSKIQAKARLLEERLEAFKPGDIMSDGDVFSELAAALQSAQPKIQKMCEEESEDHEAVARLLEINDSIHRTVERYKLMKKGDMEAAAKVASGAAPPVSSGHAANELSLIDFDGEGGHDASQSNGTSTSNFSQAGGLENDLLGLDIGGSSSSAFGQGGNISLGFGANSSKFEQSWRFDSLRRPQNPTCALFIDTKLAQQISPVRLYYLLSHKTTPQAAACWTKTEPHHFLSLHPSHHHCPRSRALPSLLFSNSRSLLQRARRLPIHSQP